MANANQRTYITYICEKYLDENIRQMVEKFLFLLNIFEQITLQIVKALVSLKVGISLPT